ncbi:MAG: YaaA family protein, partial [Lachnospiraceae bacterium]|nr:YaaA family protein [Lachnospiraceae bacterium]
MAPEVFSTKEFDYLEEHLRILSGFYGILRPFDGVAPYRLEMQAKLGVAGKKDLYSYWGDLPAKELFFDTKVVINLASKEYSRCISKYLPEDADFITCVFGEEKDGKVVEKATMCKMLRGEMVRYMAENQIDKAEEIKDFDRRGYGFSPKYSDETTYVFVKENNVVKEDF